MNYVDRMLKTQELVELIKKGKTGEVGEVAKKLHITETSLRRRLEDLKDMGADIRYDYKNKTYYFYNDFTLKVEIKTAND